MKTGLTKKQKITELYYNAKDPMAEVYTHDTKLKRRLLEYAAKFPELCRLTEDDEQGGLRFEITKWKLKVFVPTRVNSTAGSKLPILLSGI